MRLGALLAFLDSEAAGGVALIVSAVVALALANSPAAEAYHWALSYRLGTGPLRLPAAEWINDGLMALFFLLVGLELRCSMTEGELASPRLAAMPGLAALGGMIVPAVIYAALNWDDALALRGWAVPVATDIAFALAVMSVLGRRVPTGLKEFLVALAIMDDLGAIVVIALFYTRGLGVAALAGAALVWAALFGLNRGGVRRLSPYLLGGAVMWLLLLRSGVHATLAGVALAVVIPKEATERLEEALNLPVAFFVLPIFGLANAGLSFASLPPGTWADSAALGVVLGLFLGKQAGVFAASRLALRLGLARLPEGVTMRQLYGAAVLCGIGFTMSLFINDLAFRGSPRGDEIKLAVFVGSLASAVGGLAILWAAARKARAR
ncbi:MAG: Na+/H+ antiporter NhaA [Acetobacteraceae bacterium]|nr:Na+/H+ antiporter NhaA [Acetobacteraceae bacterium]